MLIQVAIVLTVLTKICMLIQVTVVLTVLTKICILIQVTVVLHYCFNNLNKDLHADPSRSCSGLDKDLHVSIVLMILMKICMLFQVTIVLTVLTKIYILIQVTVAGGLVCAPRFLSGISRNPIGNSGTQDHPNSREFVQFVRPDSNRKGQFQSDHSEPSPINF